MAEPKKKEAPKKITAYGVHGDMLDLTTNKWISMGGTVLESINGFVQSQVDEGKVKIVLE